MANKNRPQSKLYAGRPGEERNGPQWPGPEEKRAAKSPEPGFVPECPVDLSATPAADLRHFAAARLAQQMDVLANLTEHCEAMAAIPSRNRLEAVNSAARVVAASAFAAKAMAEVTEAEHRHRRIVETIQKPAPQIADSNSNPDMSPAERERQSVDAVLFDTLQRKMLLYMNLLAAESFDPALKEAYPELYEDPPDAAKTAP